MLDPAASARLTELAQASLGELAGEVCAEAGVDPHEVYEVALAGNATMTPWCWGSTPSRSG